MKHHEALLAVSKTSFPSDWGRAHFYPLVNGPSRFYRIYFVSEPPESGLASQSPWLEEFQRLRLLAQEGRDFSEPAQALRVQVLEQLAWQESEMFPLICKFLGTDRPTREMGYEHQGLRRFLPELEQALEMLGKRWERFSLDFVHLLEHHIEHEENGLYPIYDRLLQGGKGGCRVQ